ncbi:Whi2p ASCRUDRAFT_23280, partial [Ascoidea rubescens DSM 1968]
NSPTSQQDDDYNTLINLNIRGSLFKITREELVSLPESILLCLFPNGLFYDINGNPITNLTENDIVYVNYSPICFNYIIKTFNDVSNSYYQLHPNLFNNNSISNNNNNSLDLNSSITSDVLLDKPAIIVLREDLDFYCIPPIKGLTHSQLLEIKIIIGNHLAQNLNIFNGLGYYANSNENSNSNSKPLGTAEKHLLDMLCSSGFKTDSIWGHRSMEPNRTVIESLALVRLKNENSFSEPNSPALNPVKSLSLSTSRSSNHNKKNTSSKLLLFWRKPARKCWWSNDIIEIDVPISIKNSNQFNDLQSQNKLNISVHIRRVWTLELSVIG